MSYNDLFKIYGALLLFCTIIVACVIVLKKAFDAFDHDKKGSIGTDMVGTILTMLGYELSEKTLKEIIQEVDEDGKDTLLNSIQKILRRFNVRTILINNFKRHWTSN